MQAPRPTHIPPVYGEHSTLPHKSRFRIRRVLSCIILPVLVAALSCCVMSGGLMILYRVDPPPAHNILLLGNDARPGSNDEQIARTDTIMILRVDPPNQRITLFSIPRDVYLNSPTFGLLPANTIIRNAELQQTGSGVTEMIETLETDFGLPIDHYVRLNFEDFEALIDAVGGVDIDVPKQIIDNEYPTPDGGIMRIEFQPGPQTMNGHMALIYARTRHADDDYQRAGRQQQVMQALVNKLKNPTHWPAAWRTFDQHVETDAGFGDWFSMLPAAVMYRGNIETLVMNRSYLTFTDNTARPDMAQLNPWLDDFLR